MTARRSRGLALLLAAVLLATVGCGGTNSAKPEVGDPLTTGSVEDQLGFDTAGLLARQAAVENAISACMRQQGFTYIPIDPFAARAALVGSARLSDEDFRRQFGYGISTLYGRAAKHVDPNARARSAQSPADRAAYDRALAGENLEATFAQAIDTGDFTQLGGCTKQATEAVFGGAEVLTSLQGKLDQLDDRILEDQRMVRAVEAWSSCMSEAGYRYSEPDQTDVEVARRLRAIVGPPRQPGSDLAPQPYDPAALAALARFEVELANADLRCEQQHIDPVERVVRAEQEARFRQDNRDLLTRVRPPGT